MRRRTAAFSALLSVLLLVLTIPAASAGPARTEFAGFVFPAGMFDSVVGLPTGTSCTAMKGTYVATSPPACVLDPGTTKELGDGRTLIRNEVFLDQSLAWHTAAEALGYLGSGTPTPDELRRTGYNVETFNANFDATFSGTAWGSWAFYQVYPGGDPIFTGTFTGSFDNGKGTLRAIGIGVGEYKGEHVWMDVFPSLDVNMTGVFRDAGSDHSAP